jgi:hypothetical protein
MRAMSYLHPDTRLSRHFRLRELIASPTADEHGIEIRVVGNSPVYRRLVALVDCVLEPLRRELGRPVYVTSGYRPPKLNELVGGAPDSQHTSGEAADIGVDRLSPYEVAEAIQRLDLPVDQCIYEFGRWVHVSYGTRQRREYLTAYTDEQDQTQFASGLHRIEEVQS